MALSPTLGSTPAVTSPETIELYETGLELLDAGDAAGLAPLIEAGNLGYAPAQLKLVGLYQTGEAGVPQDEAESRLWARKAAEGGDPRGMHAYGMYLYDGVGGDQSRSEALTWLIRAADRGLIDSQFNAAKIYEAGDEGIAADPAKALTWYMIAARGGDAQAEVAVDRLASTVSAEDLARARTEADAFSAEALG
nr:tetratricopeptide repeat protein [Brevundimonas variabilis]